MKKFGIILLILSLLMITGISIELNKYIKNANKDIEPILQEASIGPNSVEEEAPIVSQQASSSLNNIDNEIISHIDTLEKKVDLSTNTKELTLDAKLKLKEIFITLTDFIFYDGTIKGITFNELSATAKQKVLDIYVKIDQKIESAWPNYKDTIKTTSKNVYTNIKEEVEKLKEKILEKYKDAIGEEKYDEANQILKEDRERLKESASSGKNYVKKSYETIKEKANGWYQNIKESSE